MIRNNRLSSALAAVGLSISAASCVTCPPEMGKPGMLAFSKEHKSYICEQQASRPSDEQALLATFLTQSPREAQLSNEYEFFTQRLATGSYFAAWESAKSSKSLILCNGLGSDSLTIAPAGRYLSSKGISVFAIDRRGSGLNAFLHPDKKKWKSDIVELARQLDKPSIISQCFSTGLVASVIDENPELFSSVFYLTPSINLKHNLKLEEKIQIGLFNIFNCDLPHRNPVPIEAYLSSKENQDALYNDPLFSHKPTTKTFSQGNALNKNFFRLISRTRIKTYVLFAYDDQVVNTQDAFNKIIAHSKNNPQVNVWIIPVEHYMPHQKKALNTIQFLLP